MNLVKGTRFYYFSNSILSQKNALLRTIRRHSSSRLTRWIRNSCQAIFYAIRVRFLFTTGASTVFIEVDCVRWVSQYT